MCNILQQYIKNYSNTNSYNIYNNSFSNEFIK